MSHIGPELISSGSLLRKGDTGRLKPGLLKQNKISFSFILWLLLGIAINVISLCLAAHFGLPLYFDAIGTILISMVWGSLPGITTAVVTNIIYSYFSRDSLCYALIGVFVAIRAAQFAGNDDKGVKKTICFIADLALVTGILGTCLQYLLIGKAQFSYVADTAKAMAGDSGVLLFMSTVLIEIVLNLVDKGLSVLFVLLLIHFVPKKTIEKHWNSRWKQTPLTSREIDEIINDKRDGETSLRLKVVKLMVLVAVLISVVLGAVSARINYEEALKEGRDTVVNVTKVAASLMEPSYFEQFLKDEKPVPEYTNLKYVQYNDILISIRESFQDIEYLYVYDIREDGCHIVFDTDETFQSDGVVGEKLEFDEAFMPLVPDLLAGKEIDVQENNGQYGYFITAYEPIYDNEGRPTSYYVGADIAMESFYRYIAGFVIRMVLSFSGFFALIVSYGLWMASHSLVFPISVIEKRIDSFVKSLDDQKTIDESVKKLEKADIHTGDELQRLYRSVREMSNTVAEQMRSIRILTRSNEKMQRGLIITMADIVENQSIASRSHISRTTAYVRVIMSELRRKGYYSEKLTDKYMSDVEMTAPLYDIGKIKIPDSILGKQGALDDDEKEIMKTHTTAGKKILDNAISTVEGENYLKEARNMAAYHHENWDGTGYPIGLHGEVIPLSARIMAVADSFEELTYPKAFMKALTPLEALENIKEGSGTRFDPKCAEAFSDAFTEVRNILRQYPE